MIIVIFAASTCSGPQTTYSPARTGEYVEVSCEPSCAGHTLPIYETAVFDTDFIERYEDTLNVMFDHAWTLLSIEEIYEEPDWDRLNEWLCHLMYSIQVRSEQFLQWTIEYQDGNGDTRHFVFNNRTRWMYGFSDQVIEHVTDIILDYYTEHFVHAYMEGVPLATATGRIHGGVISIYRSFSHFEGHDYLQTYLDTYREWTHALEEYKRLLDTPEGAIPLAQLTPANVFKLVPFRLSISFREELDPKQQHLLEDMIEAMDHFTNNRLNAQIRMGSHFWNIVQGKHISIEDDGILSFFEYYVFESYRGVFW